MPTKISWKKISKSFVDLFRWLIGADIFSAFRNHAKRNKNIKRAITFAFTLLGMNLLINAAKAYHQIYNGLNFHPCKWLQVIFETFHHPVFIFFEHSWIEIFSAVIIYILLEDSIAKHFAIPKSEGVRNHKKIIENYALDGQTEREIRILDISIYDYLKDSNYDMFKKSLGDIIKKNKSNTIEFRARILLLHPDTYLKEMHERDFTVRTRETLKNMKTGLGLVKRLVDDILSKEGFNIQVKLLKRLPPITFTTWDNSSNFSIPPPRSDSQTYLMNTKTELGESFITYFDEQWNNKENTVDLYSYLYVIIKMEDHTSSKILWCGGSGESDLPRYIVPYEDSATFNKFYEECYDDYFLVEHNGKNRKAKLKGKLSDPKSSEYNFVKTRIKGTLGIFPDNIGDNVIFQLEYLSEHGREIRVKDPGFISYRMKTYGCCFVSHMQYDVNMTTLVENFIGCIDYAVKELLVEDKYDVNAIHQIKTKYPAYKNKPRKRLFFKFKCDLNKNKDMTTLLDLENGYSCNSKISFTVKGKTYKAETVKRKEYRTYKELKKFCVDKGKSSDKMLEELIKGLQSIIESDMSYILGEEDFATSCDSFNIYVSILRSEVDESCESAYPTPQNYSPITFDYQVLHLINRYGVTGGVTDFCLLGQEKQPPMESFLLNKPMDSIYINKMLGKKAVCNKCEPIALKDKKTHGYRDILVLGFEKIINKEKA